MGQMEEMFQSLKASHRMADAGYQVEKESRKSEMKKMHGKIQGLLSDHKKSNAAIEEKRHHKDAMEEIQANIKAIKFDNQEEKMEKLQWKR